VPPALELLGARHPDVRVELYEMEPEHSLPALALGEFDLVIAEEYDDVPRPRHPALEREPLCRDGIVLVLPRAHPAAAHGGPVDLAALAGEAWLSPHAGTQFAQTSCARAAWVGGFEPDLKHSANDIAILIALVAAGQGVGMLPGLAKAERDERVAVRPVAGRSWAGRSTRTPPQRDAPPRAARGGRRTAAGGRGGLEVAGAAAAEDWRAARWSACPGAWTRRLRRMR
jgi:DNA-binding transcriptional LysR family regulator